MSLASLWVFWKQHNHRAGYVVAGLLLLAVGWQMGRVTSPYYAANPIVFQEAPGVAEQNNGAADKLAALQQAGQNVAKVGESPQVAGAATASPTPLVGETPLRSPSSAGPAPSTEERIYVGSKNSNLYHHKDCPSAKQIKEENQVWWPTREAAEAAGYSPSKCTQEYKP